MREEEKHPPGRSKDQTVAQLLTHLKRMRRSVPVNYQLKAELKKQLLERMKELETDQAQALRERQPRKRRQLAWIGGAALAVALSVIACMWWSGGTITVERQEMLTLPADASVEQVDIDRSATQIAYLADPSELRTIPLASDTQPVTVKLPPTKGAYVALAWSNRGKEIAVVEQAGRMSRLWIVELPTTYSMGNSRLVKEEEGVAYGSPSWSQHDDSIAYTRSMGDSDEIWVTSTISLQEWKLAEGTQPEWSPDGRFLAFRKDGAIQVMEMRTGRISTLGQGQWASWRSGHELTYTEPGGQLMEASVADKPFVTEELPVDNRNTAELIRANWAAKGKQLLLLSRKSQPLELVVSLASR
ncbi:TolB family protein [Brevibacillus sp. SAFN-007a]|uniref:TolB family protein n=1 Tax=Brevibacillus sp. SAFN-007a TaxID=3436862 RepID=UPI003F7F3D9C